MAGERLVRKVRLATGNEWIQEEHLSRWWHNLRLATRLGLSVMAIIEMIDAGTTTRCSPFCLVRNRGIRLETTGAGPLFSAVATPCTFEAAPPASSEHLGDLQIDELFPHIY